MRREDLTEVFTGKLRAEHERAMKAYEEEVAAFKASIMGLEVSDDEDEENEAQVEEQSAPRSLVPDASGWIAERRGERSRGARFELRLLFGRAEIAPGHEQQRGARSEGVGASGGSGHRRGRGIAGVGSPQGREHRRGRSTKE